MTRFKNDRRLVRRMLAADEAAFEEFSNGHLPALYRFALRRLGGNSELARELVQATLCKAIAKLDSYRGEAALTTWLCACCRNEIAAHFRREHRGPREIPITEDALPAAAALHSADREGPEHNLLRVESADLVHEVLDSLPPRYGRALEWKYLEELSVRQIAGRLDLRLKAAESLLTRARQAFREEHERLLASGVRPIRSGPLPLNRKTVMSP